MYNELFGQRLSEGIGSVALKQEVSKGEIEQRIAEEMNFSLHTIQRWQKGNIPTRPEQVAFLVRYCVCYGRVRREWARSLLTHAHYHHLEVLLAEIFPEEEVSTAAFPHRPFNLPTRRGEFLGRKSELEWALEALGSGWPVCLIEGMGGVGKTT